MDRRGRMDLNFEMARVIEPVGPRLKDVELSAFDVDLGEVGVAEAGLAKD